MRVGCKWVFITRTCYDGTVIRKKYLKIAEYSVVSSQTDVIITLNYIVKYYNNDQTIKRVRGD